MENNNSTQVEKREKKTTERKGLGRLWKEFKGEFKKIIWPNRESLIKQTTTLVVVSIIVGVLVSIMDVVIGFGVNLLHSL